MPQNLLLLKAQRVIYATAKKIYRWQLTVTIIIVVILNFLKLTQKEFTDIDLTPYIALASVSITLIDLLFYQVIYQSLKQTEQKFKNYLTAIYTIWNGMKQIVEICRKTGL